MWLPWQICTAINTALQAPSSITQRDTTTTEVSVAWSTVSGATGYYVSYQRQNLGTLPVVTPQYERVVGGASTSVTLSGLEPGTTYRIRVWSTNGTSVSSAVAERNVATTESGEVSVECENFKPNNMLCTAVVVAPWSTWTVLCGKCVFSLHSP